MDSLGKSKDQEDRHRLCDEWNRVRNQMRAELGSSAFKNWLSPLEFEESRRGTVVLRAPKRYLKEWLEGQYAHRILALWRRDNPRVHHVAIVAPESEEALAPAPVESAPVVLGAPIDPALTFESFVVGAPNALACNAAHRIVEGGGRTFNPLFLFGASGLGKTHLMHAIANAYALQHPGSTIVYMNAEAFTYRFTQSVGNKEAINDFKKTLRAADVLLVDDIQFIFGKTSTEQELFYTLSHFMECRRPVIMSADRSPAGLSGVGERMRSRLSGGVSAQLQGTTMDLRLSILKRKLTGQEHDLSEEVLTFLAQKITTNVRELEGALNRLLAQSSVSSRPITQEDCDLVLYDLIQLREARITVEGIQRRVAEHFGITRADLSSAGKARSIARPRQVAMYLTKTLTTLSLPNIGRRFGGRDHTTVVYSVKTVEKLMKSDEAFAEEIRRLRHDITC